MAKQILCLFPVYQFLGTGFVLLCLPQELCCDHVYLMLWISLEICLKGLLVIILCFSACSGEGSGKQELDVQEQIGHYQL